MNCNTKISTTNYSIDSESPRWWWPSATVGGFCVAAIATILVVPTTGYARPVESVRNEPSAVIIDEPRFVRSDDPKARQCFMIHPRWNVALDGPQPVCGRANVPPPPKRTGVLRPWLDY